MRRTLVSGLMMLAACNPSTAPESATAEQDAQAGQSYAAGHFQLEIDGQVAGLVKSATATKGSSIASLEAEPSAGVFKWLSAALHDPEAVYDVGVQELAGEKRRATFSGASVTEVKFDDLDANSNKGVKITLALPPSASTPGSSLSSQQEFKPSNFKLKIGDLPTTGVKKVEALTWKAGVVGASALRLTLPDSALAAWKDRYKSADAARSDGALHRCNIDGTIDASLPFQGLVITALEAAEPGYFVATCAIEG
jgi:hypothetical protein